MSVAEVINYRIPQVYQTKFLGKLQAKHTTSLLSISQSFTVPTYSREDLKEFFKNSPFTLEYPIFDVEINLNEINDWRKDFANNKTSPLNYYGNIAKQDFAVNGDVKYIAELSRFHFMPFLAFKSAEDEGKSNCYLNLLENILNDWNTQNPYLYSINWTSGIEVAIRSVNLIYTHIILQQFDCVSKVFEENFIKQLTNSYHFLKNHLSFYSSANNHLTAELMGLNVISSYFNGKEKERKKWKKLLEEQIDRQVLEDGVHMELCTHYHAEVVDQFLVSKLFIEASGRKFSNKAETSIKKMFNFIEHIEFEKTKTIFGDNDEGAVVYPYWKKTSLYESQLATSNFIYNTNFKVKEELDFRNYLLFGDQFKVEEKQSVEENTFFKSSGYIFWYDQSTSSKLSIDVGKIGDHLLAAHGHSDIFHFNLTINGLDFLIDSGTYQYHTKDIFWRNYFKGISAHNTLSVNGFNHAENSGRMSWLNRPQINVNEYIENEIGNLCKASTNAFKKEGIVEHNRSFLWKKSEKKLVIEDELVFAREQEVTIELFWNFHPEVQLKKENQKILALRNSTILKLENDFIKNAEIISGEEQSPLAWYSGKFGTKIPSNLVRLKVKRKNTFSLTTRMSYKNVSE
tara:strand:+ start:74609 stop:76489 length:1881 start_codon:yes stop_codon:yes gene_type:complete